MSALDAAAPPMAGFAGSVRRISPLAWPVFVGQISVVAFSTVDTLLLGRHSTLDLAALSVGGAAYITVFIGLMGLVLAISPIAGQLFGARKLAEAGRQLHQTVWLALAMSLLGCTLLLFPAPFVALARMEPEVELRMRSYLSVLAFSLPASLLFSAYRGFNTAVSRPKAVMVLQLCGLLAIKIPLTALLTHGMPAIGLAPMGVVGCALATAVAMWTQALAAFVVLRRDRFYAPFELWGRGLHRPDGAALRRLLKLGVPMGLSILIEVTGFSLMAVFISRISTTAVAGHQIAANLVSLLFMLPMALSSATGTLVAQRIGARDFADARRLGWHGVQLGLALAALLGTAIYAGREGVVRLYTQDAAVMATTLSLLAWVVIFHIADAGQTLGAFILRAYHVATAPMVIFAMSLWGVGLGGGYVLAFDITGRTPTGLHGAPGFWAASTCGLIGAAVGLLTLLVWVLRQQAEAPRPAG